MSSYHKNLSGTDLHVPQSHNAASHSDISSSGINIDDAVDKKHAQNTDTALGAQAENLDMNTHKVVNVTDPSANQDAATKKSVDDEVTIIDKSLDVINGTTLRPVDLSVTSDGADITASLSSNVGTTITFKFSDGLTEVDVTTPKTVLLTEGTDTIPVVNYIYVLKTDPTTLVSNTTGWPAATELCSVAKVICQSATTLQSDGPLKQHTWMDEIANDAKRGHLSHMNAWIRGQWATYESGVVPSFSGTGTATIGYASTSGVVRQLHTKTFPSFSDGTDVYCVNDPDTPYRKITNIADLLKDSSGDPLKDETYGLVFWGAMSDDGDSKIFVTLPSCGERDENKAREDKKKCINYNIPEDYRGVGFLIYRLLIKNNNDTTWTLYTGGSGDDLRGQFPNTGAGSSTAIGTEFPDGASGFTLYNTTDSTKEVQVDLSAISTATTRTITFPDANVDLGIVVSGIAPITLEYKLYREALKEAYIGYIDCQLVISTNSDFSTPTVDIDTATSQTDWLAYCAASDSYEAWSASGMPSTDVRSIIYIGATLTRGTVYYYRWRTYKHGDTGTATDYKGGMICL